MKTQGLPENRVDGFVERGVPGAAGWWSMHADHLARYNFAAGMVNKGRVLDAGTGPGYGAAILKLAGATEVVAIDIDEQTLQWATNEFGSIGVHFMLDDCETLEKVAGQFDMICNFENIEHLKNPEKFLQVAKTRLSPGGVLLCSSPDREAPGHEWIDGRPQNPHHINEWYAEEFRELLSKHFRNVEIKRQIESVAASSRREAVKQLGAHLSYLWSNPFARVTRAIRSMIGRPIVWGDISAIAAPSVGDYPIVSGSIAKVLGLPKCLYAVCKDPII